MNYKTPDLLPCVVLAVFLCASAALAAEEEPEPQHGLTFSVRWNKEPDLREERDYHYRWCEPAFFRAEVCNKSGRPMEVRPGGWSLEIARGDDPLQSVQLSRLLLNTTFPVLLEPDECWEHDEVLWWRAEWGDLPEERRLVFGRPGRWRYRITQRVRIENQDSERGWKSLSFAAEGILLISTPEEGFRKLIKTLRGKMGDHANVRCTKEELDGLIEEFDGTCYQIYFKWQRLRRFPWTTNGYTTLRKEQEGAAEEAINEFEPILEDVLENCGDRPTLMMAEALKLKGHIQLYRGELEEARATLQKMKKLFPHWGGYIQLEQLLD